MSLPRPGRWGTRAVTWTRLHPRASAGLGGLVLLGLVLAAALLPAPKEDVAPPDAASRTGTLTATGAAAPPSSAESAESSGPAGDTPPLASTSAPVSVPEVVAPVPAAPQTTTTVARAAGPQPPPTPAPRQTPAATRPAQSVQPPASVAAPDPRPTPSEDVYYSSCLAARLAGAAPLREGQPGYRRWLDWDGDGVACE
ncbi:putative calcium-binding protein [Frankia sp. EI5c]|uniref:excalibur calcium-binding domain-containing protein n=1 Tax=Frankia sp. EI5c TaxID=683316 RepID=UPI0007C2DBB8|nr:excalibur calcium-binding domain-containing protein [Frankia sp. EI5c]OAA26908.1 putative calcium-binding protein [Frankia sp. EI5c]